MKSDSDLKIVLEKYKVIEEIGKGGMGRVYMAHDERLERTVALKELVISELVDGEERSEITERFIREAQTAANLNHPNIVTIFDVAQENGKHYIAMEYIPGRSLKEFIEKNHTFVLDTLLDILLQIASGMEHAHSKGVIHRDIKPDNIKVIDNNVIKIMDFGIASMERKKDNITKNGALMGTIGYMSPEQLYDSKSVDNRADIFSFGAMLYEIFTQRLPFDGETIGEVIISIMTCNPIPPRQINPSIPRKLESMILKCLEKEPDKRYNKFKDISNELMALKFVGDFKEISSVENVYDPALANEAYKLKKVSNTFKDKLMSTIPSRDAKTIIIKGKEDVKLSFVRSLGNLGDKQGEFSSPRTIYYSDNFLYVADTKNSRVQIFDENDICQLIIEADDMKAPCSIAVDNETNQIFVLDAEDCKIRVFNQNGEELRRFGSLGDSPWKFKGASSILSLDNKLYVLDTKDCKIKVFNLQGKYITSFGKMGEERGEYKAPYALASDNEKIFVLDQGNSNVQVINKSGIPELVFGSRGTENGKFTVPKGLGVDSSGRIYVTESLTHRLQVFSKDGKWLYSMGKKGNKEGEFSNPEGVCISNKNKLYVLDRGNNRVQIFTYLA